MFLEKFRLEFWSELLLASPIDTNQRVPVLVVTTKIGLILCKNRKICLHVISFTSYYLQEFWFLDKN